MKLEILGRWMAAMSTLPFPFVFSSLSLKLSSSSRSNVTYGITPRTCFPVRSSNTESPGFKISTSPRNLLMTNPLTISRSCSSRSARVPTSCANTPPRSMSPTRRTGAFTICASPILTISSCFRLISAGLPAPSITTISCRSESVS